MTGRRKADPLAGLPWAPLAHEDYRGPRWRKLKLAQRGVFLELVIWAQTIPQQSSHLDDRVRVMWGVSADDLLEHFGAKPQVLRPVIEALARRRHVLVLGGDGRATSATVADYFAADPAAYPRTPSGPQADPKRPPSDPQADPKHTPTLGVPNWHRRIASLRYGAESDSGAVHTNTPRLETVDLRLESETADIQRESTQRDARVTCGHDFEEIDPNDLKSLVEYLQRCREAVGLQRTKQRDAEQIASAFLATESVDRAIAHVKARVQHIHEGQVGAKKRLTPMWCWGEETLPESNTPIAWILQRTIEEHELEDRDPPAWRAGT